MSFELIINGVDRTEKMISESLELSTGRLGVPDTLSFDLEPDNPEDNIKPEKNQVVQFKQDSVVIFEGRVLNIDIGVFSKESAYFTVSCQNYVRDALKGDLIAEIYHDQTVAQITSDIITRYTQFSDFTDTNVDCDIEIDYAFYDHKTLPDVLRDLASRVGYDFYIDKDKDIHFFLPETEIAPFSVTESNKTFLKDSFKISERGDKLLNAIIVEGGEYTSNLRSEENFTADGSQTDFELSNQYAEVQVEVDSVSKTVGSFSFADAADYDCLYDYSGRRIIFRTDNKPTSGQTVDVSGFQKLTVRVQVEDPVSIGENGKIEKKEVKTILKTPDSARQYAFSEIQKYSAEQYSGGFKTREKGLRAGQRINISHSAINFSKDFYVQTTSSTIVVDELETTVSLASSDDIDGIGVLARLINSDNESTTASQVLDLSRFFIERIDCQQVVSVDNNKILVEEDAESSDSVDVEVNKTIQWVLPEYTPTGFSDPKRVPLLDWSGAKLLP